MHDFMRDVAARLATRVKLTVDGHKPIEMSYAQVSKMDCRGSIVAPETGIANKCHRVLRRVTLRVTVKVILLEGS